MTGSDNDDLHLPYAGRGRTGPAAADPDSGDLSGLAEDEDVRSEQDTVVPSVTRVRPPPRGLSRRDRHEWRGLEVARVQRETLEAERFSHGQRSGWSKGFMRNPPRRLGRQGRNFWLAAEREATSGWWAQRRASDQDIDARSIGVLVVVLLLGSVLTCLAVFGRQSSPASADPATAPTPSSTSGASPTAGGAPTAETLPATPPATAALSSAAGTTRTEVPGAGNRADAGVSGAASTGPQPIAGRWQPTPAGGVDPVPVPAPVQLDPTAVKLVPQPVGAAPAAQLATPVGAVTAWLARTCPSRFTQPYGADVAAGRPVMTGAGWTAAEAQLAGDAAGPQLWKTVVSTRETRTCDDFDVQLSADAPITGGVAFVGYAAHRVVTAPGAAARVEQLAGARIAIRQSDGRWLVDRPVVGG